MLTPYDWQEAVSNRASFIEGRLQQGAPILALSIDEGIVILTYRKHSQKIYEVYDQLAFSALGQQSDVEALRLAAIDFAHQEGFNRSEKDVTLRRVVTAISTPIKKAYADFSTSPFITRSVFAEVGTTKEKDAYAILDFEGDFKIQKSFAYVIGSEEQAASISEALQALFDKNLSSQEAWDALKALWLETFKDENFEKLEEECAIIRRGVETDNRLKWLTHNDPAS